MRASTHIPALVAALALAACGQREKAPPGAPDAAPAADLLASSPDSDWRTLDPENTLYMELPSGRVVIELAPAYAPNIVANIKALVRENYFDGAAIIRSQDNYVVQWSRAPGAPGGGPYTAQTTLAPEFVRPIAEDIPFTQLPDGDVYAPEVGFSNGFPVARGREEGVTWLTHCYGMVGVGRDVDENTGAGQELYAVIGHAPRHLDRNVTLVGRVVYGIERFSTLPRGTGPLGFYETAAEHVPIARVRIAADVPAAERTNLEALRTDSQTFAQWIEQRRNRSDEWFKFQAGRVELCNVPLPVRAAD